MIKSITVIVESFSMFKIKCQWNTREDEIKNTGVKFAIRCSNRGKETMIDVDNMNTTYQDLITAFPSNTILYYVGIL